METSETSKTRYTLTLGDGTAISVESKDSWEAHETVAKYIGIPQTNGFYVMFSRLRAAGEWTPREIGRAVRQWNKGL